MFPWGIPKADEISRLPDEALIYILSYLNTRDAVRTSILNKRWIHLWKFCHNIEFPDIDGDSIHSNSVIKSVLLSRDAIGSRSINSLHLRISYPNPYDDYRICFDDIIELVNSVVQRNLQNLLLHLFVDQYDREAYAYEDYEEYNEEESHEEEHLLHKLPTSILTCKTLVSLDLGRFLVQDISFSSDGLVFPSLKTLYLRDIHFPQGREFLLLLSGCPILQDLRLFDVVFESKEAYVIIREFKNLTLPKLAISKIIHCLWYCLPLGALATSNSLWLDTLQNHPAFQFQFTRPCDIPIFHNLTHLHLNNSWDLVVQVLHHCPKLQNLTLYQDIEIYHQESWVEPELVPHCLLSHLRTVTMEHFGGLMLATYILKNASILQTMKIKIYDESRRFQIERKLFFPKASATCQLLFYC